MTAQTGSAHGARAKETRTLEVPTAVLTYDVRPANGSTAPALLLIGSPMGAAGFETLASHFPDRTIVTYDPRGVERSRRTDGANASTPEEHADDLHRLVTHLNGGEVDVFASSGGAVNGLAFVAAHPNAVRTLVAHEPPLARVVPDSATALRASKAISDAYERGGFGPAMARFIMLVSHVGPLPADYLDAPDPDPAMFGLPSADDGARNDPLFAQNMISSTHYQPNIVALRAAPTRIVIAVGAGSAGQLAERAGRAVAELLGLAPVVFPGDHGGFLGGEYGQTGEPDAFAAKLREVLTPG